MLVLKNQKVCPNCGGKLYYYDTVKRIVKTKNGNKDKIYVRRMVCHNCKTYHRELPKTVLPYKQYDSEIIYGVIEGLITPETLGFEDYPCEQTMLRWKSQNLQVVL